MIPRNCERFITNIETSWPKDMCTCCCTETVSFVSIERKKKGGGGREKVTYATKQLYIHLEGVSTSKMLSIKIGYTKDIDKRLESYDKCYIHPAVLASIPSPPIRNRPFKAPPLLGAYLLEQILHAVLVQRQNDRQCSCRSRHAEVFDFEPVLGVEDEWKGAQSRVQDLTKQMNEWADIIRNAGPALGFVSLVHRPVLSAIERNLEAAGQPLYPNWKRQNGISKAYTTGRHFE